MAFITAIFYSFYYNKIFPIAAFIKIPILFEAFNFLVFLAQ